MCVKINSLIKLSVLVSTAAPSSYSDSCTVSMCVLRGRDALMRQDYENQSPYPSRKAEVLLFAYRPVLIRLTRGDTGRTWYTVKDTLWQAWTATRGADPPCPCICMYSATCDAKHGRWVAIMPMLQFWWHSGWPGMGHGDITSLSNKITAWQHDNNPLWAMEMTAPGLKDSQATG